MRFSFTLFLVINSLCQPFASETIFTHIFSTDPVEQLDFADSLNFVLDPAAQFSIADILRVPDSRFRSLAQSEQIEAPTVIWTKIQLTNAGLKSQNGYFQLFTYIDSI